MSAVATVQRTHSTTGPAAAAANRAGGANRDLMPIPMDLGNDSDGLTIMFALNNRGGVAELRAQRANVNQGMKLRDLARKAADDARKREVEAQKAQKREGGLFEGFKNLVSNVVSNAIHIRPERLVKDAIKDVKTTLDVTNPQFWDDVATVAKAYGKLVAAACAVALTAVTGGAFAVACAVVVCVCMATSMAMEEAKMGDRLGMSEDLQMGISIGCAVVATAASFGAGAAGSASNLGTAAARNTGKAIEAAKLGGAAISAAGEGADATGRVIQANIDHTADLLSIAAKQSQQEVRRTQASVEDEISMMSEIVSSYEKAQGVLVDAINVNEQATTMLLNGGRA